MAQEMRLTESQSPHAIATDTTAGEVRDHSSNIITLQGLRLAAGTCVLALLFFSALLPNASRYGSGLANDIWIFGAAVMGVLSLVRVPPTSTVLSLSSLASTGGALVIPVLMRPVPEHSGMLLGLGIALEAGGVVLSQVARLYMGRCFGVLPANRGIVSSGPFAFIRHPVYLGWLVLTLGFVLANPNVLNLACLTATPVFVGWRIVLEERLLGRDPEYRAYAQKVRYRLIPGVV
jgi:protein-S-isoprenylcysteine O-methyltransferase Ste14